MGEGWCGSFGNFPDDGRFFQYRFIEAPAAILVRTARVGQAEYIILRIGLQQLITMWAGIVCHCEADAADTWISLHALEGDSGGREFSQISGAVDAG